MPTIFKISVLVLATSSEMVILFKQTDFVRHVYKTFVSYKKFAAESGPEEEQGSQADAGGCPPAGDGDPRVLGQGEREEGGGCEDTALPEGT